MTLEFTNAILQATAAGRCSVSDAWQNTYNCCIDIHEITEEMKNLTCRQPSIFYRRDYKTQKCSEARVYAMLRCPSAILSQHRRKAIGLCGRKTLVARGRISHQSQSSSVCLCMSVLLIYRGFHACIRHMQLAILLLPPICLL